MAESTRKKIRKSAVGCGFMTVWGITVTVHSTDLPLALRGHSLSLQPTLCISSVLRRLSQWRAKQLVAFALLAMPIIF
jgi:hypothetical protein